MKINVILFLLVDAVAENVNFPSPTREEFFRQIGEAVRFGKQRYRNTTNRRQSVTQNVGRRERMRHAADELLEIRSEDLVARDGIENDTS